MKNTLLILAAATALLISEAASAQYTGGIKAGYTTDTSAINTPLGEVFETDIAILEIQNPRNNNCGSRSTEVRVRLFNAGSEPQDSIPLTLEISGDINVGRSRTDGYVLVLPVSPAPLHRANGVDMDMEIALFHADREQNLDETLALARQAYANRPSIHAADVLAWALYKTGQYEEAWKYSEEALQLETKDSLKLFHAGMVALELGNKAQAREYLAQALAINPEPGAAYINLGKPRVPRGYVAGAFAAAWFQPAPEATLKLALAAVEKKKRIEDQVRSWAERSRDVGMRRRNSA
jgi:hypothetical protein